MHDMSKVVSHVLNEIVHDRKYSGYDIYGFIAGVIARSKPTVSRILSEEATMDQQQVADLARAFADEHDDTRLSDCFVGLRYCQLPCRGIADGRYEDEAKESTHSLSAWIRAMEAGDSRAATRAAEDMMQVAQNMLAEGKRI